MAQLNLNSEGSTGSRIGDTADRSLTQTTEREAGRDDRVRSGHPTALPVAEVVRRGGGPLRDQ